MTNRRSSKTTRVARSDFVAERVNEACGYLTKAMSEIYDCAIDISVGAKTESTLIKIYDLIYACHDDVRSIARKLNIP